MSDDPVFWMTAKREGSCAECEDFIIPGNRMVWDTKEFKAYCSACGEDVVGEDPRNR